MSAQPKCDGYWCNGDMHSTGCSVVFGFMPAGRPEMKTCTKCRDKKELAAFTVDKRSLSGFDARCKKCTNDRSLTWNKENASRYKGNMAAWELNNKTRRCAIKSRHMKTAKFRATSARNSAAGHASKLKATPAWADMKAISKFYSDAELLSRITAVPHEVDHIYPLRGEAVTGLHVESNLQILTKQENCRKGNRMPDPQSERTGQNEWNGLMLMASQS